MDKLERAIFSSDANIDGASLEIGTVRTGGEFLIFLIDRRPIFEVVFFGGRSAKIASGDIDDVVWNIETLPDIFFDREIFS